jgi:hypothetical protein
MVARITHTRSALEIDSTEHIKQDTQDDIRCMWRCAIRLEEFCVHVPCSINDRNNDLTVQMLNTCSSAPYAM